MSLSTRDLELIDTLARELHFGRAAEALAMRQPQLSVRLAQIERGLGVTLFVRRPRVALTPAGEIVSDAARRAFGDFGAAAEQARLIARGQVGAITVAVASTAMLSDVPLSIQRFRAAYPDIALTLRDMHSAQQPEALRSGLVDVAVTRELPSERSMKSEIFGYQRFVALVPDGHRLAQRNAIGLADLAPETFVLFNPAVAPGLHHQINALCIRAGFTPKVGQVSDEWYTVLGFVRAGVGVTIALDIFGSLSLPGVAGLSLTDQDARSPLFLAWNGERTTPARDLLLDWLRKDVKLEEPKRHLNR
jgi:DNA-binding transcriptional LysR family regulator